MQADDAFGAALLDWVRGGTVTEILERDDGYFEDGAGHEAYLARFGGWPTAERQSVRHLRGRVLDAGCGVGRVSKELQARGFDVVGIDESPLAVRAARLFGAQNTRRASADVVADEIGNFDSVVLFGNNFGIFATPERARRMLTAWAKRATLGTRIFAESTNAYTGGAPIIDRRYYQRNKELGRAPGVTRYRIHYKELQSGWLRWLFVSRTEMHEIVRGTGWHMQRVLGDGPIEPYVAILERH